MAIVKITITGYIDFYGEKERKYVLSDLDRITRAMIEGNGIMTDIKDEDVKVEKVEDLPEEIQDFFRDSFEEEE